MKRIVASLMLVSALTCSFELADAAQKKKPTTKPKVSYYELCKQLVAPKSSASVRVQRYQVTKDGTLRCWYFP